MPDEAKLRIVIEEEGAGGTPTGRAGGRASQRQGKPEKTPDEKQKEQEEKNKKDARSDLAKIHSHVRDTQQHRQSQVAQAASIGRTIGGGRVGALASIGMSRIGQATQRVETHDLMLQRAQQLERAGQGEMAGEIYGNLAAHGAVSGLSRFGAGIGKFAASPVGLGIIGGVAGFTAAIGAATGAAYVFSRTMTAEAERLRNFSPEIGIATAERDMRRQLQEFRHARMVGPELAEFVRIQTDFSVAFRDVMIEVKEVALEWFLENRDLVDSIVKLMESTAEGLDKYGGAIVQFLQTGSIAAIMEGMTRMLEFLGAIEENTKPEDKFEGDDPFWKMFLNQRATSGERFRDRSGLAPEIGGPFAP